MQGAGASHPFWAWKTAAMISAMVTAPSWLTSPAVHAATSASPSPMFTSRMSSWINTEPSPLQSPEQVVDAPRAGPPSSRTTAATANHPCIAHATHHPSRPRVSLIIAPASRQIVPRMLAGSSASAIAFFAVPNRRQ